MGALVTTMKDLATMNKLVMEARHKLDWIETTGDVYISKHAAMVYSLPATYKELNKDVTIYNLKAESVLVESGVSVNLTGVICIDDRCVHVRYDHSFDGWLAYTGSISGTIPLALKTKKGA